ncbi:MAG TPA: sigma-70 family RNA polymerase sigma factor, partial [Acidimicrobiales bacterium]|nr:sigma-70 family RNA polymerase sigma factor [Acidimicrobiales bacterium]
TLLWDHPERFEPDRGTLRSYLLTMAHRRAVDAVRREERRRGREERASVRTVAPYDLEHEVWDLAVASHVREALGRLADAERQVIELAYFSGYTYREVAALLGQPEGTVKSRIRSGLARLRAELADAGVGE